MKSSADVVVIGGGVIGCSILFNLAKQGITNTVLVERDILGAGSTGRSSGVACFFGVLLFSHGQHFGEINARLTHESLKILFNFEEIVGANSGLQRTGAMFLVGPVALGSFERNIAMLQSMGIDTKIISVNEAQDLAPYLDVGDAAGICYEPQSGYADPPSVGQGYAAAARDLGAELSLGNPVLDIEVRNEKLVAVITAQGRIETDTAVVATGPWTGRLMKKLGYDLPLIPTRHEVFFLKQPSDTLSGHVVVVDLVNEVYFRTEKPDLTLVSDVGIDEEADPESYSQKMSMELLQTMWQRVAKRMPAMEEAELFTSYVGLYTNTPDGQPVIDRVEGIDGLYICAAFNGFGFKLSPAVGIVVSELIAKGKAETVDITALRMGRFQSNGD